MNKVILIGRLSKDPEVRYSQSAESTAICKFSIAVDRPYQKNTDKKVDFLNCICFGKRAETIGQYFHKGNRIAVTGRIQTGEYTDKQCMKKYTTDIFVDDFEFVESKNENGTRSDSVSETPNFYEAEDDGDLPF
jgi:single-strand binding protein